MRGLREQIPAWKFVFVLRAAKIQKGTYKLRYVCTTYTCSLFYVIWGFYFAFKSVQQANAFYLFILNKKEICAIGIYPDIDETVELIYLNFTCNSAWADQKIFRGKGGGGPRNIFAWETKILLFRNFIMWMYWVWSFLTGEVSKPSHILQRP